MAGIKFSYFAVLGFVTQLFGILATVDTSGDGIVDGKEKLAAANRAATALIQSFPNLTGKVPPEKMTEAINHFVAGLDCLVKA